LKKIKKVIQSFTKQRYIAKIKEEAGFLGSDSESYRSVRMHLEKRRLIAVKSTGFKVFNRFSPAKSIRSSRFLLMLEEEEVFFLSNWDVGDYINVQENISTLQRLYRRSGNYISVQKNISTFSIRSTQITAFQRLQQMRRQQMKTIRIILIIILLAGVIYWLWTGSERFLPYVMLAASASAFLTTWEEDEVLYPVA
jgi:hypothetical protein